MEKTRRMWNFIFLIMTTVCCLSLTSCGSDDEDDNNDVNTPAAFEDYAAKYQLTGTDSPYSSVEFTESGNYIITKRYYNANTRSPYISKPSTRKFTFANLLHKTATRSGDAYSPILYGTYTVDTDGTYVLSGYGNVKITQDNSDNAYSLNFMPNEGSSYTYKASKQNLKFNSSNSSRLCRTWNINSYQYICKIDGKTIADFNVNSVRELNLKLGNSIEDIIEPRQITFTKAGTYMVMLANGQVDVSTWMWNNSSETELLYDFIWGGSEIGNGGVGCNSVSYKNGQLVLTEQLDYTNEFLEEGDCVYEALVTIITYHSESK